METATRRTAAQAMSAIPRYAEGGKVVSPWSLRGIVNTIKSATTKSPEDVARDHARADYAARSAAERAAKPAATTLATPPKAITSYSAGTATTERMKAVDAMATGGPVTGPGTGTSDEVPILASNGEYVIRAAAVEEIGTEVLDALNALGDDNETDEPMGEDGDDAEGGNAIEKAEDPDSAMEATEGNYPGEAMEEENRPKYAAGGIINKFGTEVPNSEEQQRQLAAQTSNYVAGAQANAAARPAVQAMAANPVTPQSVANIPTGGTGRGPTPAAPVQPAATSAAPLDAQAQADRATYSGAWNTVKDVNQRAGAVIADVGTLIPRSLAGAYDSAFIRPMRAAGVNADYLSPKLVPAGSDPASMMPFYDKIRAADAMNQPAQPGVTPSATAAPFKPSQNYGTPAPQLAKPSMPQANPSAPNPASGSPDQVMPEGKVDVSMQPNGVKSFSGKDISGQPQYTGSAANTMKSGVMNSVPGMSQSEITKTLTNPDGSQWSSRDNAIMAANIRDGVDPYRGTSQGQANELRALALSPNGTPGKSNAMKMLAMQSDEKRTAGQQQIEKDRNSTLNQGTALDNQAKQQMLAAQTELANAKTPEQEAAAEKKLRALQGKYGKDMPEQYAYAPGGQEFDPVANAVVTRPGVIYNKVTGETKQQPQQAQKQTFEVNKVYTDSKGNRAKWDGKQFVPA